LLSCASAAVAPSANATATPVKIRFIPFLPVFLMPLVRSALDWGAIMPHGFPSSKPSERGQAQVFRGTEWAALGSEIQ
jgi:hypothetical protein